MDNQNNQNPLSNPGTNGVNGQNPSTTPSWWTPPTTTQPEPNPYQPNSNQPQDNLSSDPLTAPLSTAPFTQPEPNPAPAWPSEPTPTTQTTPITTNQVNPWANTISSMPNSTNPFQDNTNPASSIPAWTPPADTNPPLTEQPIATSPTSLPVKPTAAPAVDPWASLSSNQNQTNNWTPPIQTSPFQNPMPEPVPQLQTNPTDILSSIPSSIPDSSWPTPQTPQSAAFSPEPTIAQPDIPPVQPTEMANTTTGVGGSMPTSANLSPLDNPWGSPSQPPSIDGTSSQIQPSWMDKPANNPSLQENSDSPPSPIEAAPTDLSHLLSNSNITAQPTTENLIAPTNSTTPTPEVPSLPVEGHHGIPGWLIGVGTGLLILVIGASAYFILGVGQPNKTAGSLPAVVASPTTTNETLPTSSVEPAAQASVEPAASGSANFGEFQGGSSTQTATSAADLLRQRQQ